MAKSLTVTVLLLLVLASVSAVTNNQQTAGACRAKFDDGELDLTPLDGLATAVHPSATFTKFGTGSIGGLKYDLTFNPCTGFDCNTDKAAAVCATDAFGIGLHFDLGSQLVSNVSRTANGTLQLRYVSVDKTQGKDFVTLVTLSCSSAEAGNSVTDVILSDGNGLLTFQLNSRHCCLIPNPAQPGGWSPGDYIVLCFFLAVLLYIGITVLLNWRYFQRSGVDLLPHREMWLNLALLVKDGCEFTFIAVRGRMCQKSGYTEIK